MISFELLEPEEVEPTLEDVWLAHTAVESLQDELQEKINQSIDSWNEQYLPLIYTAMSVSYEVRAKAIKAGFSIDNINDYVGQKYVEEAHPIVS